METKLSVLLDASLNIIVEDTSLKYALDRLDKVRVKGLLVVDSAERFVAALTDGDVRRAILAGASLETPVSEIANFNPQYLEYDDQDLAQIYLEKITILPIVDLNKKILKVYVKRADQRQKQERTLNLPVVIMAGGLGTRLYPYTKILPKPLIPIGDIPISEMIINEFCRYGCNQFYLIVNHKKNMIKAYFNEIEKPYYVEYVDEEKPLGTGGGLGLLKGKINSTFILTNCDVLIKADLTDAYKQHQKQKNKITMVCCKKKLEIPYGVVEENENNELLAMTEKPSMTFLTNTGVYFIEPEIVEELVEGQKRDFPDIINECKLRGDRVGTYSIENDEWLDMGQIDEMERMKEKLGI